MRASIDLYWQATGMMSCIVRQVLHAPMLLDLLLQLAHFVIQSLNRLFLLMEFDYHLVLLTFECIEFLLTGCKLILSLYGILLDLFREINERFQFLFKVFDLRFALC